MSRNNAYTNSRSPKPIFLLEVCVGLMGLLQFAQNAIDASFDISLFRYIRKSREQSTVTGKFLEHNRPTDHAFEERYASKAVVLC